MNFERSPKLLSLITTIDIITDCQLYCSYSLYSTDLIRSDLYTVCKETRTRAKFNGICFKKVRLVCIKTDANGYAYSDSIGFIDIIILSKSRP